MTSLRYHTVEPIGKGATASVYKAFDSQTEQEVALKVLHPTTAPEQGKRLERESALLTDLDHPCLPKVFDQGTTGSGRPYISLQLLNGETMAEVIQKLRDKDPETVSLYTLEYRLGIARKLCEALEYAHSRGVIHRDLKPENILLGQSGRVWILDWGLAGQPDDGTGRLCSEDRLTRENTFLGTLRYAPPEQIQGVRSFTNDIYSLGITLYEFFTLQEAHGGDTFHEVFCSVLNHEPAEAHTVAPVPRSLGRLLSAMIKKSPADRVAHMRSVKESLHKICRTANGNFSHRTREIISSSCRVSLSNGAGPLRSDVRSRPPA